MSERTEQVQDLDSLIQATPYQNAAADPSHGTQTGEQDGVASGADNSRSVAGNEGLSPAATNVQGSTNGETGQSGVTNQDSQGPGGNQQFDPRMIQELQHQNALMQQTIQNQTRFIQTEAQRREAAEEQEFQRRLEDLEPDEREAEIAKHERDKLRRDLEFRQRRDQYALQQQQLQAKNLVATMVVRENNLPPEAKQHLLRARTMDDMNGIARDLVSRGYGMTQGQQQQQQQQQQQEQQDLSAIQPSRPNDQPTYDNPAHLGGDVSASSDVTPDVKWGSGDLMSYIQQAAWQEVPVRQE